MSSLVLFAFLTIVASLSFADVQKQVVNIGCTISAPPFVIKENNRGILLDILHEALASQNITANFSYGSNHQTTEDFTKGKLDALCITRSTLPATTYTSAEPAISFQNSAVTLKENGITLHHTSDLSHYRVLSFHAASTVLPQAYSQAIKRSPLYLEASNQAEQVKALFLREVDVVIIGEPIFRFYLTKLRRSDPGNALYYQKYSFTELFEPSFYYPAFRTKDLRDKFDQGFKSLQDSGQLERIHKEYQRLIDRYFFSTEQ